MCREGYSPTHIIVYNLSPIYNKFIKFIRDQHPRPKIILLLLDSAQLNENISIIKKIRYKFKHWVWLDEQMLPFFDAAVCLSPHTQRLFESMTGRPSLWMPGAVSPSLSPPPFVRVKSDGEPLRLGYFGSLSDYAGILDFTKIFDSLDVPFVLEIRGAGKLSAAISQLASKSQGA
jgi:hypothetical protein